MPFMLFITTVVFLHSFNQYREIKRLNSVVDHHYDKFIEQRQDYEVFIERLQRFYPEIKVKEYRFISGLMKALPLPSNYEELHDNWLEKMEEKEKEMILNGES